MKRTALIAGQEYLYATSNDWDTPRWGKGEYQRVLVISADQWAERFPTTGYRGRGGEPSPTRTVALPDGREFDTWHVPFVSRFKGERSDGVLVIGMAPRVGLRSVSTKHPTVLDPRFLRAPYAEGLATVTSYTERRDASRSAAEKARHARAAQRLEQWERLRALLGEDARTTRPYGDTLNVEMPDLERLLALAEVGARVVAEDQE